MGSVLSGNVERLRGAAEREGLKTLVLAGEANLVYALGVKGLYAALVLSRECGDYLVTALLDYWKASLKTRGFEVKAFYRGGESGIRAEVPRGDLIEAESLPAAVARLVEGCGGPVGVDSQWLPSGVAKQFSEVLGDRFRDASRLVASVRRVKSSEEIELIESAIRIAEKAFSRALEDLGEGVSELALAGRLTGYMMEAGAWGPSFPVIVAFYSNTALPHHTPEHAQRLSNPGPVLVDWGAVYEGYMSDTTRSAWRGPGGSRYKRLVEDVVEALENAIDTAGPGVNAADVDRAARFTLERKGLAKYFIHGTGHGVGVEIHEEPYLRPASKDVLEPGMVVTIEPGVYMPGLYGVRVEEMVLITKKGRKVLTSLPRTLEL